ncbi:response regulator transcription factor [Cesiribacter sp. SM1]|uniref:response regulator transcription factor n=1 Tax=Cesiribacter sp. SM1 TaxID=2861196 RepID=UPI001CD4A694|nr:response regulator transcription factor [Cesiribacter sp. SM1]
MSLRTRIAIVEDNTAVREGFATLLNSIDKYMVVGLHETAEEAIVLMEQENPHIVLMDIGLPGMNGIEAIREMRRINARCQFIIISVHEDSELVFQALCAGATGYITKNSNYMEILNAINEVLSGGAPMSTKIARMVISSFQTSTYTPLTKREMEVLQELARGKSYSMIAKSLGITNETSRSHIKSIYSKLEVNTKYEALEKAKKDKLI